VVCAQQQMSGTLVSIPARLVHPQIVIVGVHQKVRDCRLIDKAALNFAVEGADDLFEAIKAERSVQATA
jgi:chromate reductase